MIEQINETEEVIDLRAYVRVISKWRNVIIAGTLVAMLIAGILSFFVMPPVYEAQALLLVNLATDKTQVVPQQNQDGVDGVVQQLTRIPVLTMNTYMGQVKSDALLRRVIKKLNLDPLTYTTVSLGNMIQATVQTDSNLIQIKVQNQDPKLAATIANTTCSEFLALLSEKNQQQLGRSVDFLQQQRKSTGEELDKAVKALIDFQGQGSGGAAREQQDRLQSEVNRLKVTLDTLAKKTTETEIAKSLELGQTTVVVVSDSSTPIAPIKPNKRLNVAIAFILGLMIFTALAFVLEYLDFTIKTPEDVTEQLGLPSLGVIPEITERSRKASYGR